MIAYPTLDRLLQDDPDKLSSRQVEVLVCRIDYGTPARGPMQLDKDARMAAAVPALLAHIDELYGDINDLKGKCGKQADMLARHCRRRDEQDAAIAAAERKLADVTNDAARARAESVAAFVERRLNHRDGDASQTQIDNWRVEARMAWNNEHPTLAELLKTRGV